MNKSNDAESLKAAVANMLETLGMVTGDTNIDVIGMDTRSKYPLEFTEMLKQLQDPNIPTYGMLAFAHAVCDMLESMPDEHIPETPIAVFVMEIALGVSTGAIPVDESTGRICFQDFTSFIHEFYERNKNDNQTDTDHT